VSNFIYEEKSTPSAPEIDDDGLVYDEFADVSEDTQKSMHWSAEAVAQALQKSSEDESWGVEGMEKAGPYIGPKGGKWADAKHTVPWKEKKKKSVPKFEQVNKLTDEYNKVWDAAFSAQKGSDSRKQLFRQLGEIFLKRARLMDRSEKIFTATTKQEMKTKLDALPIGSEIRIVTSDGYDESIFEKVSAGTWDGEWVNPETSASLAKWAGESLELGQKLRWAYSDSFRSEAEIREKYKDQKPFGIIREELGTRMEKSMSGLDSLSKAIPSEEIDTTLEKAAPTTTTVQTLIFDKDKFDAKKAKAWASEHDYVSGKVDVTEDSVRLRQKDPGAFQEGSFRTISFKPGIKAVIGRPKKVEKSMNGLEQLEEHLEKAATPVGGKTKGGYTVKMVGGKRTYVKEKPKPTEPAAETARRWGKKSPKHEEMEDQLDDLTWQYDHGKGADDKKKAREGLEKLLVAAKEAKLPMISGTSLPEKIEATLRTRPTEVSLPSKGETQTVQGSGGATAKLKAAAKQGEWSLSDGKRVRWGNKSEITADIKHFKEHGKLPERGYYPEKTEKSMSTTTGLDALEKSLLGGYGISWADRMMGTPFEVEALQCIKKFSECDAERAEVRKKYPYGGYDDKNRVERAKLSQKRDQAYKKIDVKEDAERKKQAELEKKYLDWRIEQAKEAKKSDGDGDLEKAGPYIGPKGGKWADAKHTIPWKKSVTGIEALEEHLMKSDIPTGQPTKVPTGSEEAGSDYPCHGGPLAGVGKTPDGNAPNPDDDQDAQGQPTGVPASTVQDWGLDEEARRVMGGVGGVTMKSMGSLDKDKAIAEQRLSKSAPDVHPYRMSAMHGNAEDRVARLSKGGVNENDPRNAIIAQDILCKSCSHSHPAMLTACPYCGDGAIGREVLYKGNTCVTLDNEKGVPTLRPAKPREEDILIKE
jgi:hypothetical protein